MENSWRMKVELVREERRKRVEEWEKWHTETENMDSNKHKKSSKKVTITLTDEEVQTYVEKRKRSTDSVNDDDAVKDLIETNEVSTKSAGPEDKEIFFTVHRSKGASVKNLLSRS